MIVEFAWTARSRMKKRSGSHRKYGSSWKPIHIRGAALAPAGATRPTRTSSRARRARRFTGGILRSDEQTRRTVATGGSDFVRALARRRVREELCPLPAPFHVRGDPDRQFEEHDDRDHLEEKRDRVDRRHGH